jgi:predicted dehydrogenase
MPINIGLIGGGGIAAHHIRGYRQTDATIVMVSDAQSEVAQRRASELGCDWSADYSELLAHPDIRAVSICVPNWLHYEVAMAALEAGKAVLCEKPMSISLEQAEALRRKVHERSAFFQVAYMKRYHPVMQRFRDWISAVGPVEMGLLRCYQPFPEWLWTDPGFWFTTRAKSGGGPLVHGGSHMLDLLHWCLGDVAAVDARVRARPSTDVEWHTSAILEMAGGATILFECAWFEHSNRGPNRDGWDEMLQLRGPDGVVTLYPMFWDRPTALVPWAELYTEAARTTETYATGPVDYFAEEIRDFVARVEAGQPPAVTVDDGYWVDRVIHELYRSGERRERILLDTHE